MPRLFSLFVGIDSYPNPAHSLYGCVNDARGFADFVKTRIAPAVAEYHPKLLSDGDATRANILAGFSHLSQAATGDTALFFYAGHGSQQSAPPEFWDIEPDRLNETLVCWDSRQPGGWDLADKELAVLLKNTAAGGAHVIVILDCCHSGSGTRDIKFESIERRIP